VNRHLLLLRGARAEGSVGAFLRQVVATGPRASCRTRSLGYGLSMHGYCCMGHGCCILMHGYSLVTHGYCILMHGYSLSMHGYSL
jgi:hypothetical protein